MRPSRALRRRCPWSPLRQAALHSTACAHRALGTARASSCAWRCLGWRRAAARRGCGSGEAERSVAAGGGGMVETAQHFPRDVGFGLWGSIADFCRTEYLLLIVFCPGSCLLREETGWSKSCFGQPVFGQDTLRCRRCVPVPVPTYSCWAPPHRTPPPYTPGRFCLHPGQDEGWDSHPGISPNQPTWLPGSIRSVGLWVLLCRPQLKEGWSQLRCWGPGHKEVEQEGWGR